MARVQTQCEGHGGILASLNGPFKVSEFGVGRGASRFYLGFSLKNEANNLQRNFEFWGRSVCVLAYMVMCGYVYLYVCMCVCTQMQVYAPVN